MGRHLFAVLAVLVVVADSALMAASHRGGPPSWGMAGYVAAAALVVVLGRRWPVPALGSALALSAVAGGPYVLTLWTAYRTGRAVVSRRGTAALAGVTLGGLGLQLAVRPAEPRAVPQFVTIHLVFVVLPLLVGRYLAQHGRLVAALDQRNRELRWNRELVAERERLRERLRIARELHDSLGHRLGLVSVQAAALEVSGLPPAHDLAVRRLAGAARGALDELHELVGALRAEDEPDARAPGVEAVGVVVAEFRAAGVPVTLERRGEPLPLSGAAGRAAYRVVEEGLTNAAKHAPGRPVTVTVEWEQDALLLSVTNPLPPEERSVAPAPPAGRGLSGERPTGDGGRAGQGLGGHGLGGHGRAGHGLAGLGERVRPAGGFIDHGRSGDGFRLFAMLPATPEAAEPGELTVGELTVGERVRTSAIGVAAAVGMLMLVPAGFLLGTP
ncbi:hypothetical protein Misp01_35600 [Microtetraspora sp. NBRC 13810]|uniref:sensor histidine kinase n=1 Tax=Microtetraspora sp. NBRC 13810 TaxID=3030990 RepID=UPI0024A283C7|nr:histidine kinase [Microtetraspora sp. NBRC 13810]GLW08430.1 hypothetical protein Misp01_35600 [Microtetraspora sp. NBRC 13810]